MCDKSSRQSGSIPRQPPPRGSGLATRRNSAAASPPGLPSRAEKRPQRSVGSRCPGQSEPQPRKGWSRSFSKTSFSTTVPGG